MGARTIRVNAIAPGTITSPRIPDTPERLERTRQGLIPAKRRGTVDEVGKVALFLVSDLASYVTGQPWSWTAAGWPPTSPAFLMFRPEARWTPPPGRRSIAGWGPFTRLISAAGSESSGDAALATR